MARGFGSNDILGIRRYDKDMSSWPSYNDAAMPEWEPLHIMKGALQDPIYHQEGDVWTHTKLVTESIYQHPAWENLSPEEKQMLYRAALLHDIGKPSTEMHEGDRIRHPGHAKRGEMIVREMAVRENIAPDEREILSRIVGAHMRWHHILDKQDPEREILLLAAGLPLHLLAHLGWADMHGRYPLESQRAEDTYEMIKETALEWDVWNKPYRNHDAYSFWDWYGRTERSPHYKVHPQERPQLIMMHGLPGSGKSSYIENNYGDLPVIELDKQDDWQKTLELLRTHLRIKQDVVWDATNTLRDRRKRLHDLAYDYGFETKIIWLEEDHQTLNTRNKTRPVEDRLPESAREKMLRRWQPPWPGEATHVEKVGTAWDINSPWYPWVS